MTDTTRRASFFRQSGWLMIANVMGGAFMWVVHTLSRKIGAEAYGTFGVFLSVAMCVPTIPLQMVLAHQTALALAKERKRELAGMIRLVWMATFCVWLVGAIIVAIFHRQLLARWGISDSTGLWITLPVILLALWMPVFWGTLQGSQNFLWLGWSMMLNGIGRLGIAALAVFCLTKWAMPSGYAAGMMLGVFAGMLTAAIIACWHTRSLWAVSPLPCDWRNLLREIIPPMLGFAAFQFLFTADTMFVKAYFTGDEAGFYLSAGTLSRALMWFVGPLASVMFPRLVHSTVKGEKSNLMGMVLLGTALLAIVGAGSLSVLGPFIVRIVSGEQFVKVASELLPWYAFAMVPLSVANVLLNNLLAKSSLKVVIPLCVLAIGYAYALTQFHATLVMVLKTVGVCNLILLGICAWFTWFDKKQPASPGAQTLAEG